MEAAPLCEDEDVGLGTRHMENIRPAPGLRIRFDVCMSLKDMEGWTGNSVLQGIGIRHGHSTYVFLFSFGKRPVR